MSRPFTTGLTSLDDLIDGVRVGDNLVIQSHGGVALDVVVERFVAARDRRALVACTAGIAWPIASPDVVVTDLLEANSHGGLDSFEAAQALVATLDEQAGGEALFVFWTLTAMQEAWGPDKALSFFLWACPRLYRRGSIALWPMDPDRHRANVLRRLADITQVIVDIRPATDTDLLTAEVTKADGRPPDTLGRRVDLDPASLAAVGSPQETPDTQLGRRVMEARNERAMSQTEVARLVGISPSALSQFERGTRGVSAETITRIWGALGVPFGPSNLATGYDIVRRSSQPSADSARGMTRLRLASDRDLAETWLITIDPGASGRGTPFAVKSTEIISVLSGVVDLEVGGHPENLHEGDTVITTAVSLSAWSNPGTVPVVLHWTILFD